MKNLKMKPLAAACKLAAGTAIIISASSLATAQTTAEAAGENANTPKKRTSMLEEVTVTAQRREESAQDVAISITVFNQEQIANANMTNSNDLAIYTPSMTTNTRFGPENASFSIRGFTQELRTTASVGVYFAEVVSPRGQTSQTSGDGAGPGTLFDLANVQVLKGPQGTLFGRNTTGGAVILTPEKPGQEFGGYIEGSLGNYDSERVQGALNIPVNDKLAMRIGIDSNVRDGHLNNITNVGASQLGNTDYTAGRFSILWDITDKVSNYTLFQTVSSETAGYTSRLFACNDSPQDFFGIAIGIFTGPGCQQQLANQEASGNDGYYDIVSTVPEPITAIKERRFINTTTWIVNDNLTFKNIFSYAHLTTKNGSDIFGTRFPEVTTALLGPIVDLLPIQLIPTQISDPNREFAVGVSLPHPDYPVTSQETWVEEIQLQGVNFDDRLVWQAGLYYETSLPDGPSGNISAGTISCDMSTLQGDPSNYNCFDITGGLLGSVLLQDYRTEYENKAIYAQGSYDLLENLTLTTGLRYTWDDTEAKAVKTRYTFVGPLAQAPTVQVSNPSQSSDAPTGLLELQYRPFEETMLYAKYIRGYRQGSVNPAADPGVDVFDQEKVDTYEIGAKTSFGGPIPGRFNIAVFDNELTNQQLQTGYISPTAAQTLAIFNAGKSEIKGFEAELTLLLSDGLTANLTYSKLDTELLEQDSDNSAKIGAAAGPFGEFSATPIADQGDELPFAPEQSYVASLMYNLPTPVSWGSMDVGVTYVYTGEQRAGASSTSPFSMLDAFELWNMNFTWMSMFGSNFDLSVFGTNLTDEEYETYVSATFSVLGFESRMSGLPKQYGARLRYSF
ncbi:TonB-dependent receptor [Zhongshania aquimaris]|uniref:TonB-dependent receptor n=1 Tax=Zhongshania aquimaris TaxID=2857107 RepID=A0ABS6VWD8_9GAMM|nr:TonB-dependent receptor [Zhongshania aquimaris]MBW2942681.1 TonB-dependent receptor [Zhongshania aquimaris]